MSWWDGLGSVIGGVIGGGLNYFSQQKANEENIKAQREFAQNSISWKVEDAKRAGVHPLAALGASGYQASPPLCPPMLALLLVMVLVKG